MDYFEKLKRRAGHYVGAGVNHTGDYFTGYFELTCLYDTSIQIKFSAAGNRSEDYHRETSIISYDEKEQLCLWNINSNVPGMLCHQFKRAESIDGSEVSLTFGYNDSKDATKFREEISIDLWSCGNITYRYAWGMPGKEFKDRSSAKLKALNYFKKDRPLYIKNFSEILSEDIGGYPGSDEKFGIDSRFGKTMGLTKVGIHHEILPPGRRTSWPHAESHEDEFIFVVEGYPQVWLNGILYDLVPGDFVAFPYGTGIGHTVINNSAQDVKLVVGGSAFDPENKCIYSLHEKRNQEMGNFLWKDAPKLSLGKHDGLPNKIRQP